MMMDLLNTWWKSHAIPKSNMALVGLYKIKETEFMYGCLQHLFKENIKTNGEYNLTDAFDL